MATVLKAVEGDRPAGRLDPRHRHRQHLPDPRAGGGARGAGARGLGATAAASAIEDAHPQVERFELTTNMIMVGNVRFYLRHGYEVVEQVQHAPTIRLAFMRKIARR